MSMHCYGLFSLSLRRCHYCDVMVVSQIKEIWVFKKKIKQKHPDADTDPDANTGVTTIALLKLCTDELKTMKIDDRTTLSNNWICLSIHHMKIVNKYFGAHLFQICAISVIICASG